ncbi:unnamed protein product [Adineta steineri]|uniref:Uncharacterized protein n=1 Tax=Adineta steineri TaxID=433720 RepID=A0A815CCV2_9BILA|nr:unnamed protein product [Adineta steineri]CAF3927726.1 unnamed protein product [Adineta steineri]
MASSKEHSYSIMPSPAARLHMNNGNLSADIHQQGIYTSDYRTKYVTNAVSPMLALPTTTFTTTTSTANDSQHNNIQYQKIENIDLSKKVFIDRQIKKAKSLSGLIKGTVLSRHAPLHPSPNTDSTTSNGSTNNLHENLPTSTVTNNEEDSTTTHQQHEQTNETRRPRVSFSQFHKIQYFEDNTRQHRHRHRSARKASAVIGNNHISPVSTQHSELSNPSYRPLSRQQLFGQETTIKKQQLTASLRGYSSRTTHLPDIINETPIHEKHVLQREKPLLEIPEPAAEIPINSGPDGSRESSRAGTIRPSVMQSYTDHNYKQETNDRGLKTSLSNSSITSLLGNRQRLPLHTLSLRQQFTSPTTRAKTTNVSNNHQTLTSSRRSESLKYSSTNLHSNDDNSNEINDTELLSAFGHRPMTGISSSKHIKRNYIIHFDSKNSSNEYSTTNDSTTPARFHNVLKFVRSPYLTSILNTNHDSNLQTTMNNANGTIRSAHINNDHGSSEFHGISNTIVV